MADQTYLIKIKKTYHAGVVKRLADDLDHCQGKILLLTDAGYVMIVHLDEAYRSTFDHRPEVALLGGVHIRPRPIRHIRVDHEGHLVSASNIPLHSTNNQQGG